MNIKCFLKRGLVLVIGALILTGCGNSPLALEKKTSAVQSTTQQPDKPSSEIAAPTPTESNSSSNISSSKSLSQLDADVAQVEQTIDKTLDSLDQILDSLDF